MVQILEILKSTINEIRESYYAYWNAAANPAFFYVSLLYIFYLFRREKRNKQQDKGILLLVAATGFIIVCPVSAWVIMEYCMESEVYRRLLWMIPIPLLIGYAGTRFLFQEEKKGMRWILGLVMAGIFVLCGVSLYTHDHFQKATNPYKVWDGIPQVCEVILEDANVEKGEKIGVIGGVDAFVIQARQYTGAFRMPYGREALRGFDTAENAGRIYQILYGGGFYPKELAYRAKRGNYPYLVYQANPEMVSAFQEAGYELLREVAGYHIYKLDLEKVADILITRYGQNQGEPSGFYTIETIKGKLIVVDGGTAADAEYVRSILAERGNIADAWILTSFGQEYTGAFSEIYKNPGEIQIKKVYAPKIFRPATKEQEEFLAQDIKELTYLKPEKQRKIAGVTIQVLSVPKKELKKVSKDFQKDGSLVFQVLGEKEKMLFTSEIGSGMSSYLQQKYGKNLHSAYLQLPSQGQEALDISFYRDVNPDTVFFDTPVYFFEEESSKTPGKINQELLKELQADIIYRDGSPYHISLY